MQLVKRCGLYFARLILCLTGHHAIAAVLPILPQVASLPTRLAVNESGVVVLEFPTAPSEWESWRQSLGLADSAEVMAELYRLREYERDMSRYPKMDA